MLPFTGKVYWVAIDDVAHAMASIFLTPQSEIKSVTFFIIFFETTTQEYYLRAPHSSNPSAMAKDLSTVLGETITVFNLDDDSDNEAVKEAVIASTGNPEVY